jgi:nitrogen-specific signal transduction histidine kinase
MASQEETEELTAQLDNIKNGIRELTHEINNPLGVIRMGAYFLEVTNPDPEKKAHYLKIINDSLDKIEDCLKKLRALRENPASGLVSEGNHQGDL